jgi:hypothetical protein
MRTYMRSIRLQRRYHSALPFSFLLVRAVGVEDLRDGMAQHNGSRNSQLN